MSAASDQPRPAELVSVIVPVFNGTAFLGRAIESVVGQTWPAVEVVVVDDGSTDGSGDLAESFGPPVRVIRQANAGHGAAKNAGVEASAGAFVAFLDADDAMWPAKLERQVGFLAERPELGFCVCRMRTVYDDDAEVPDEMRRRLAAEPPAWLPSGLVARRGAFEQVGPFAADLTHSNDTDWFLRARDAGVQGGVVDEVLVDRHMHGANSVNAVETVQRDLLRALRRSTSRRRD